ncbi:MAG: imidazole glycerol phosphate synthase, glutamine amidotransferase subunit [Actinobacteria bacterium RBG_13_35_12]|uniref:Imidazole glycerol phosphate synthase subunit HisH n=1 Tax=Candidatus Sediminicultor quintus TaxID=1797291 RepID=A0A1F5AEI5_9BACT|nr:MAG: imidazole glycerol phosphate synthase, glutamine amidotransferase subunit [Actinobacteria bacterium RBG_13_35_12]OGD16912.1 MAG: imidazole glycerol phosphate synthase, glutamine amidotransferase subunit [Candidatus Atribacteria bacterium RBG_19FT_COMBO_35_14]
MMVIVDYGMGNLKSVQNAFSEVGYKTEITDDPNRIKEASTIVLPGVGAFRDAIKFLKNKKIDKELIDAIKAGKPFLGICLGMQLLFTYSEEGGLFSGLNVIPGGVKRFPASVKCPHLGWNKIKFTHNSNSNTNPIFQDILDESYFYFVHSYYCEADNPQVVYSTTDYGLVFPSSIWKGNLFGVQFHPEKSSTQGLKILKNFGELS